MTVTWLWKSFCQWVTFDHQFLNSNNHKRWTSNGKVPLENVALRQPLIAKYGAQGGLEFPSRHHGERHNDNSKGSSNSKS